MAEITEPILLDSTGKELVNAVLDVTSALRGIQGAITDKESQSSGNIIYGFHIDGSKSDPDKMVTYLQMAVGMTPARMNYSTGKFDYGSWDKAFFMPRPCMLRYDGSVAYYLDPNDYTKKADGTVSDIANVAFAGNAMMEWGQNGRKIYLKVEPTVGDDTSANIYIANYEVDSTFHCWSFFNSKNEEVDHFYTPIYTGSLDSDNKLRSLSGTTNIHSKTAQEEIDYAKANNPTSDVHWYTEVYSDVQLINFLLILMGKSTDTQTVFGLGNTSTYISDSDNGMIKSGTMNNKGLFYGHNVSSRDTGSLGVKVFGMENWWGNQWRRYAGHINDKGTQKIKLTYGTKDGSTSTAYNLDGTGYITVNTLPAISNGNAYIDKMTYSDKAGCVPKTASGSASTFYCDGLWINNDHNNYALRGGGSGHGMLCGASGATLDYSPSVAWWNIGVSLSYK